MRTRSWVVVVAVTCGAVLHASPEMDNRFSFKSVLAAVVDLGKDDVHGQHVQAEMERFFQTRPRFVLSTRAQEAFAQSQAGKTPLLLDKVTATELEDRLASARVQGADSAFLIQLQRTEEGYALAVLAAAFAPTEILFQKTFPVSDHFSLKSFGSATIEALTNATFALPFDASVLSREGYRVVIDRGAPSFRQGTRIAVFTLEKGEGSVALQETGIILLNRVDKNLSFGTILVENKPLEITKGNKVRFQSLGNLAGASPAPTFFQPQGVSRDVASVAEGSSADTIVPHETTGSVDVHFSGNLVSWNRTAASTGAFRSDTGFYPGASIRAQVKMTHNVFAEFGGMFGMSTLNTTATGSQVGLGSQTNQVRAQIGYRATLGPASMGPTVFLRAGYSRSQFQVDELPNYLAPSSAIFSGMLLGGGCLIPLTGKMGAGLEMNGLAFSSLSEGGGTSGAADSGLAGWDFTIRGYYSLNEKLSFETRLLFQTHTAGFSGQGTRPVALSSLSQTTRALQAGVSYLF